MQRITITLDDDLLERIDRLIGPRNYQNRSEAVRDLVRAGLRDAAPAPDKGECIAALIYVYAHGQRDLPKRLLQMYHDNHDLTFSTMRIHLDHESCLELAVLRGTHVAIRQFAGQIIAERGVRHGKCFTIPVTPDQHVHVHGDRGRRAHDHLHVEEGN